MNTFGRGLSVLVSVVVLGGTVLGACSSTNAAPPCNQDPWSCPPGQTCWITTGPDAYSCVAAGTGNDGQPCTPLQGSASCGSGLVCLPTGICALFCDPTSDASGHGCAPGQACQNMTMAGGSQTFNACVKVTVDGGGPPPPTEAGADTGSPPPPVDSGSDTSSPPVDSGSDTGGGDAGKG
jgi:hypothetical protein